MTTTDAEITAAFWKSLRSDMTVMLGLAEDEGQTLRPMTAIIDGEEDTGPIWFFTSTEAEIVQDLRPGGEALFTFASKGHDVFATVHGSLDRSRDRAVIDRLWNKWVAAWYEGGKDDPKLVLLRFDLSNAEIWRDASSIFAGIKLLLGADPKVDYKDSVAKVAMS